MTKDEGAGRRIVFLDCGRRLDSFYTFLEVSVMMAVAGFVIVIAVVFVLSGRIIRPISESYEKQKRFITDAGHEIRTPLTIINTNVDILEMEHGENESLTDIKQQIQRLKILTGDLVALARMEESEERIQKIEFPVSEVVLDTVSSFRTLAASQGKELFCRIEPMLTLRGNARSIEQLVSVLMDNALKYSPEGGWISVELSSDNHGVCLSVVNSTHTTFSAEQLPHVFDRFYRTDASRNSETGGYGIGLSVAKAAVSAHGGRIKAFVPEERTFGISVTLPV